MHVKNGTKFVTNSNNKKSNFTEQQKETININNKSKYICN